jgi:ATP/maltotriose-dependent transcriptional regulator MalT
VASALWYGPTPVKRAISRCHTLMNDVDLAAEANILVPLAGLEAMRGRFDTARAHVARAQTIHAELGQAAFGHTTGGGVMGEIELLAGDAAAAEQAFRESYDALAGIGDRAYLATRAVQLAEAVHMLGRHDESLSWSRIAEEAAAEDDVPTQFMWRSIQARLFAGSGDAARAEVLAGEAVRLAEATDALWQHAKVVLDLGTVLWQLGRPEDATVAAARSLALFDRKGSTVGASRASALLGALEAA